MTGQTEVAQQQTATFSIRYEGLDAEAHQIDLDQLGISLQGFARVLAVCAHFAETGRYNKQFNALSVQVYAAPVQEHHCYELVAQIVTKSSELGLFQGLGGVALTLVVQHVMNRGKDQEMRYLHDALKQSLGQNEATMNKVLSVMEKMADSLAPAAKKAVAPIGVSCTSIGLRSSNPDESPVLLDQATKDSLAAGQSHIEASRKYIGTISEMDMNTGACKVTLNSLDYDTRIVAEITDPQGRLPQNPYVMSMAKATPITFIAKAEVNSSGDVVKLYISDYSSEPPAST